MKLYGIFKRLAILTYLTLLRTIHVHRNRTVPKGRPVILASNHPTAFLECSMYTGLINPDLYNMTRGDLFEKPLFRAFLNQINMFPVYRTRDGYTDRAKNDAVFEFVFGRLKQDDAVAIYPEGEHGLAKRIRSMQKGLPRIAFAAATVHGLTNLEIIPVAASFDHGDRLGDVASLNFGTPLFIRDYLPLYAEQPGAAINKLLNDLSLQLKTLSIHVESPDDDALVERLLEMHQNDHPDAAFQKISWHNRRFLGRKRVADHINALPEAAKGALSASVYSYFHTLRPLGLTDRGIAREAGVGMALLLLMLFPFYLLGAAAALIPLAVGQWVVRTKVRKREFVTSVLFGIGLFFTIVYFPLILGTIFIWGNLWAKTLVLLSLPCSMFTENYKYLAATFFEVQKAKRHKNYAKLRQERCKILRG